MNLMKPASHLARVTSYRGISPSTMVSVVNANEDCRRLTHFEVNGLVAMECGFLLQCMYYIISHAHQLLPACL